MISTIALRGKFYAREEFDVPMVSHTLDSLLASYLARGFYVLSDFYFKSGSRSNKPDASPKPFQYREHALINDLGLSHSWFRCAFQDRRSQKHVYQVNREFLCGIIGVASGLLIYLAVPGYIVPFLNSPLWREIMLAPLLWQAVGLLVLFRVQKYWLWVAAFICASLPLLLIMRIGPYILLRSLTSEAKLAEVMARPGIADLWKLDCFWIIVLVILACGTFPGIWTKLFRVNQESAPASS